MFTVYIDDSGTDPKQPVAIAAALIVPSKQVDVLDRHWASFSSKYDFVDFHASECAARNPHSAFASWDTEKVSKALYRARQIMKATASKAFSFTIHKADFDAEAPPEWRKIGGQNHYTWAFRNLLIQIIRWEDERKSSIPIEYVFDWAEKNERAEIEMVLAQFEDNHPGRFHVHYSFGKRVQIPGLQCADVLAWSCFAMSRQMFKNTPMKKIAQESFSDLSNHRNRKWLDALTHEREALRKAISMDCADLKAEERRRAWYADYTAGLARKKSHPSK